MESDINVLKSKIRTLVDGFTIPKLKSVLKVFDMSLGGKKAMLQERLLLLLRNSSPEFISTVFSVCVQVNNDQPVTLPQNMRGRPRESQISDVNAVVGQLTGSTSARPYPVGGSVAPVAIRSPARTFDGLPMRPVTLSFAIAPFYEIIRQVSDVQVFSPPYRTPVVAGSLQVRINPVECEQLARGGVRLVVLSQRYNNPTSQRPLYFPFNSEIILNKTICYGMGQLRGVKGNEGSVRPADITTNILKQPAPLQAHNLTFRFNIHRDGSKDEGTNSKAFAIAVYIIKHADIQNLVKTLIDRPHIVRDKVIKMIRGDEDDDIIATEAVHSLMDPVAMTRITTPIRSRDCDHIDCLDAEFFLTFQKQAPIWKCPHCNKQISFDTLAVDDYMLDILNTTEPNVEKITVSPDGSWIAMEESDYSDSSSEDEQPSKKARTEPEIIDLLDSEDEDPDAPPARPPSRPPVQRRDQIPNRQTDLQPQRPAAPAPPPAVPFFQPASAQATAPQAHSVQSEPRPPMPQDRTLPQPDVHAGRQYPIRSSDFPEHRHSGSIAQEHHPTIASMLEQFHRYKVPPTNAQNDTLISIPPQQQQQQQQQSPSTSLQQRQLDAQAAIAAAVQSVHRVVDRVEESESPNEIELPPHLDFSSQSHTAQLATTTKSLPSQPNNSDTESDEDIQLPLHLDKSQSQTGLSQDEPSRDTTPLFLPENTVNKGPEKPTNIILPDALMARVHRKIPLYRENDNNNGNSNLTTLSRANPMDFFKKKSSFLGAHEPGRPPPQLAPPAPPPPPPVQNPQTQTPPHEQLFTCSKSPVNKSPAPRPVQPSIVAKPVHRVRPQIEVIDLTGDSD